MLTIMLENANLQQSRLQLTVWSNILVICLQYVLHLIQTMFESKQKPFSIVKGVKSQLSLPVSKVVKCKLLSVSSYNTFFNSAKI
jgi:hypothetical protein